MFYNKRSVTCGELRGKDHNKKVVLNGWVHRTRNHGSLQFVNLRDRYGITQVVFLDNLDQKIKELAQSLKMEYCISITGRVNKRPDEMINKDMDTGEIEVIASNLQILNTCPTTPFVIEDEVQAREDLRLEYRYLDLRSKGMQDRIRLRHELIFAMREFLNKQGFYEIETPTLVKSTPEGARDFVVPSRIYPGKFFALPQSPQLYKQILMVSGFDKYFQVARCYRDEDPRGDRQLEFTQLDLEMSFITKDDILNLTEDLYRYCFDKLLSYKLPKKFKRLTYKEAMQKYGSDKPDLRFDLQMKDFKELALKSSLSILHDAANSKKGGVSALVAPSSTTVSYSRKYIDSLIETAKIFKVSGLAYMKVENNKLTTGASKFFEGLDEQVINSLGAKEGDLILISSSDNIDKALTALGAVRSKLGKDLGLIKEGSFEFVWIVDFPLFEFDEELNHYKAVHHMFSMPEDKYIDNFEEHLDEVTGQLYDLVLNGYELASGSIRVHNPELQKRIFKVCNFDEKVAQERFGFLLNALKFSAPPHGGIAPGIDRTVMIMSNQPSIREVIAFPKNTAALSPMDKSPSYLDKEQLDELHLKIVDEN